MRIRLRAIAEDEILAGASSGRNILGLMIDRVSTAEQHSGLVYLDFEHVEVATASFLRESVLEFKNLVRRRWANCYPVVANVNQSILEELMVLVRTNRDVLVYCTLDSNDRPKDQRVLGELEAKQQIAFDLITREKEADASELMELASTESVSKNAWNNRLATLCRIGLVMQCAQGRSKRYQRLPIGD